MKKKQLTFVVGADTVALIEDLKAAFGVSTAAGVFKRTLAISKVAATHCRDDGTITMIGKDKKPRDIILNG